MQKAPCGCVITVSGPYKITAVQPVAPISPRCLLVVAEQSYPHPTCTRDGWGILGQLARAIKSADSKLISLIKTRWASYVYSAKLLLGVADDAEVDADREDLVLAVALQRAAGTYTLEKIDDRGPTEICFGTDEDCDGQSVSVAMFANALINLTPDTTSDLLPNRIHRHLVASYSSASVVFGNARAPKHGKDGSIFKHAFVVLLSRQSSAEQKCFCLKGGLIVEATAPISPRCMTYIENGVLSNEDANQRERCARQSRAQAKQIVIGVRRGREWYYDKIDCIFTADWSAQVVSSPLLHDAIRGKGLKFASKCKCAGKGDRDSMLLTLTRDKDQMLLEHQGLPPYDFGIPPDMFAIASVSPGESRVDASHDVDRLGRNVYIDLAPYGYKQSVIIAESAAAIRSSDGGNMIRVLKELPGNSGRWIVETSLDFIHAHSMVPQRTTSTHPCNRPP